MHSVWLSFVENLTCSLRSNDVSRPRKVNANLASREHSGKRRTTTKDENLCNGRYSLEPFHELDTSDISRNVVEKIFHSTSTRTSRRRVRKILKVNNPPETLERFEMYREEVKKAASGINKWDLRSMVDGNELLRFYPTNMSCCSKKGGIMNQFCQDPACGVCRVIQSNFRAQAATRTVLPLRTFGNAMVDGGDCRGGSKKQEAKKAVVLCRVIGGVVDMVEGGKLEKGFSSVGSKQLTLRNPDGILPCFVIVYSKNS